MKIKRHFPSLALLLFSAFAFTMSASATAAPTFNVNSLADVVAGGDLTNGVCETAPGNGICTLRAAIMKANHFPGGGVTINIPSGTYAIIIAPSGSDDETTGNLNITATTTINGAGAATTVIDGNQLDGVIRTQGGPIATTISNVTIRNGSNGGGLIVNNIVGSGSNLVTLNNVIISGNTAGDGGGILNGPNSTLTLNNSTVSGNKSTFDGGGIWNFIGGTVTLNNSTVSGNSATRNGGGIYNEGTLHLYYSTIAGNLADNNASGISTGGGIYNAGTVTLKGVLLAENYVVTAVNDCHGSLASQDYNYIQTTTGCTISGVTTHNLTGGDAFLDALQDNGGPTPTRALFVGSPAIDAIPIAQCIDQFGAPLTTDQRGFPRPNGSACDIGAYEGNVPTPIYGRNLIRNGDAEGGAGSPTGAFVGVPNWDVGGKFTAVPYNSPGGFPNVNTDMVPANHGYNFFAGGDATSSGASQSINVSTIGTDVDAGGVNYALSADLGGFANQGDSATLTIIFLAQNDAPLSTVTIGSVSAADRGNATGFRNRSTNGVMPASTRKILVQLSMTAAQGPYNDGYADNISLVLTPPLFSQSDCLFNWAERSYPGFFAPAGATSNTLAPYYYRFYRQTNAYLGTSSANNHVYYLGPLSNYSILDVGALSQWLSTSGC